MAAGGGQVGNVFMGSFMGSGFPYCRYLETEDGFQRTEDGGRKAEDGGRKADYRLRTTNDRRRMLG